MNFRVSGQKINTTTGVKYLCVYLNDSLTWETHFKNLIPKPNRAIVLLPKVRYYTPKFLLKTIYYSLFNSHLIYASQIWGQIKTKLFEEVVKLQNKAIRIINFLPFNSTNINKTYNDLKILKLPDLYRCKTVYFGKIVLKRKSPTHLSTTFKNQGLNIPIERAPYLKTVLLYQKLTKTFTGKNPSNINALIHGINIRNNSR